MDHTVIVNDYRLMDKLIKEERAYLINMLKKIKKSGCNVLLIQKSILRDAVTTESLAILSKLKIAVVKDIERDEVDFLCRSLGCKPVSDVDAFTEDKLGYAELVEEALIQECKVVKITGVKLASGTGAGGATGGGAGASAGAMVGAGVAQSVFWLWVVISWYWMRRSEVSMTLSVSCDVL